MLHRITIGTKITALLLLVVTLSVVAISYMSYVQGRESVERRYSDNFRVMASLKANQIEGTFRQLSSNLRFMQRSGSVVEALRQVRGVKQEEAAAFFKSLESRLDTGLAPVQDIYSYRDVVVVDLQRRVIYSSNKKLDEPRVGEGYREFDLLLENANDSLFFGDPFMENSGTVYLYAAAPVLNMQDNLMGHIIIQFNVTRMVYGVVEDYTGLGESGEVFLGKLSGVKADIISRLRHSQGTVLTKSVLLGDEKMQALQKAVRGENDYGWDVDYRNQPVLAYWQYMPTTRWGMVIKMDEAEINRDLDDLMKTFVQSGILIILLSALVSIMFSKFLIAPLVALQSRLALVSQGILPEDEADDSKDEIGAMAKAVSNLVGNLKKMANFAQKIGEGNYQASFVSLGRDDVLGNALLSMRDSIQGSDEKDRERNWIIMGVAETGQILRVHNQLEDLGNDVVAFLTAKIGAVQAAFYAMNDDNPAEPFLEMKASYAYGKRKYLSARFKIAEGLVGQCAAEQDVIMRTEIPDDYMTLTSGLLGEQKPQCLLFVPLLTNDAVYGVIEFAGFERFSPMHIAFMREISVIIARTIFNIKVNQRTMRLLQESQAMSEELQFQQRILQQNAEEMEATQEELRRTNNRLEEQILEVNRTQKRMQLLLENASEIVTIYERNRRVRYISPSVEPILGYSQDEMIGLDDSSLVEPESLPIFGQMFEQLLAKPDQQVTVQFAYRKKNKQVVWLEATGRNLLSDAAVSGLVVNTRDITERRRAEREERMRSQMQALSENSPDLIMRLSTEGTVFYINPTIKALTGINPSSFVGKNMEESRLLPVIRMTLRTIAGEVIRTGTKMSTEMDFPSLIGERIMQVNAIPEFNDKREAESVLLVMHDITESKRTEIEIRNTNKKITESINYAKRIQSAILPDEALLRQAFPESFMFYQPRDVVSGDFPWFLQKGDDYYIAVVDCTGHGVPGALISLIGYFILNEVVNARKVEGVAAILDALHEGVTRTLRQDVNASTRDGMDIALCHLNKRQQVFTYAGAHRPLYWLHEGELEILAGDRFPVGGGENKIRTHFKEHRQKMMPGDEIYMFSDGYTDQFGSDENVKFSPARLRQLILSRSYANMQEGWKVFANAFESWKDHRRQTDDVLLIGIKFL